MSSTILREFLNDKQAQNDIASLTTHTVGLLNLIIDRALANVTDAVDYPLPEGEFSLERGLQKKLTGLAPQIKQQLSQAAISRINAGTEERMGRYGRFADHSVTRFTGRLEAIAPQKLSPSAKAAAIRLATKLSDRSLRQFEPAFLSGTNPFLNNDDSSLPSAVGTDHRRFLAPAQHRISLDKGHAPLL